MYLSNIFSEGELEENSVCSLFEQTAAIAKAFAESEFEQYRILQDGLYQSDFDRLMATVEKGSHKEG